jgi:hypothetical protein
MNNYVAQAKTVATAATIDHAVAELWNPSTVRSIWVTEVHVFVTVATAVEPVLRRSTARGTAGSTVTPTIVNDFERALAPASGALLDLSAFTVQPTLEALGLHGMATGAAVGAGVMWVFRGDGLRVPSVNGLVITTGAAVAFPVSRVTFVWKE